MNHKRRRPRIQRAGCFCLGKANKKLGRRATRGGSAGYSSSGAELRLRERAAEAS